MKIFTRFHPTIVVALLVVCCSSRAHSANILAYFGVASLSHASSLLPVLEELAMRGHSVILLTSFKVGNVNPSISVIDDVFGAEVDWETDFDALKLRASGLRNTIWDDGRVYGVEMCQTLLQSPKAQAVIYNSTFDLVIYDTVSNDCMIGLAHHQFKCPFIGYSAVPTLPSYYDDYGLPLDSSSIPDSIEGRGAESMSSFYERLLATWRPIEWMFKKRWTFYPRMAALLQDALHLDGAPDFLDLHSKTSLVLVNGHYSTEYARSLPPLFVSISGVGIREERRPIPNEIADFIDKSSSKGFVYVSFGTVARISKGAPELRKKLFAALGSKADVQFVWKWEGDIPNGEDVPKNVYFANWLPQQDLFAHPRIKGIIGHGGMNSVNEAVYFGVPMILFPIIGDQDYNANSLAFKGVAIVLEITDFAQKDLEESIERVMNEEQFRARALRASAIFRDKPAKPLETAVWWIEFVLRHKDTSFLMPMSANQWWFLRRLLDVWFFIFSMCIISLAIVAYVLKKLVAFSIFFGQRQHEPCTYSIQRQLKLGNGDTMKLKSK